VVTALPSNPMTPMIHHACSLLALTALLALLALPTLSLAAEPADAAAGDEASLAEPPLWPIGFKLPTEMIEGWRRWEKAAKKPEAHILVWVPPKAKQIRAVAMIPNNTDSKNVWEHDAVRQVCAKHEIGVVYLRYLTGTVIERSDPPTIADETFAYLLGAVAERTGIEEFRHAPWITFGKSSRGRFPFRTTWWFPKRVAFSISYHGEVPSWPMEEWSKVDGDAADESVLHLAVNGETEWDETWARHVRPHLLNYHHHTNWLGHIALIHNLGHGDYVDKHGSKGWGKPVPADEFSCQTVWDYIALFIDKAMEARVPADAYATDGPIDLLAADRGSGYLIHPRAYEELLGMKWRDLRHEDGEYKPLPWPDEPTPVLDPDPGAVAPELLLRKAADVPADERADYFWLPDREMAEAWLKLHDVHGKGKDLLPAE